MTRFDVINDAVKLVLFAFENGKPGDIFVNKAPASSIKTLAAANIQLSNKKAKLKILEPDMVKNFTKPYVPERK